ncbi:MAG: cytochrome c553 [Reinekea sp.]|jgi:cytochrome c553
MNNMGYDMKKLIVGLFVLGGLVGFTHAAGNAENGKGLTAMCAGCHGADGNSAVASFPKLAGQGERYLYQQLQDVKADRRIIVAMTGMLAALNDQQLADIAAYYASQAIQVGQAKAELVELGEALYKAGNAATGVPACAGCHSPNGQGNSVGGIPALGGQHADYIATQLKKFQAGYSAEVPSNDARMNGGDTRMMRSIAFNMKDFEMAAVASYIQGLH